MAQGLQAEIRELLHAAEEASQFDSSNESLQKHEGFRAVVAMDGQAVPMLFAELRHQLGTGEPQWGALLALMEIRPWLMQDFPPEDAGRLDCLVSYAVWQGYRHSRPL